MSDVFQTTEDQTGIRAPWNVWPHQRHALIDTTVPLSVLFSPLRSTAAPLRLPYAPVRCTRCGSALSPFCAVDYAAKTFKCAICANVQNLPVTYQQITPQLRPAELHARGRCVEYALAPHADSPVIVFVLDTQCEEAELDKQRQAIQLALDTLPDDVRVGLISFGSVASVHEVQIAGCARRVVFRGTADPAVNSVDQFLGLKNKAQRFVLPVSECREDFYQIIEDLQPDPWPVRDRQRPARCTGLAISLGLSILHSLQGQLAQSGKTPASKLVVFVAGPCTTGPGQIVDADVAQHLRHWPDIQLKTDAAKYLKEAQKYYQKLMERAVECFAAVHVFAGSVDQVGLFEAQDLCRRTGGTMCISESFAYQAFSRSWRIFVGALAPTAVQPQQPANADDADQQAPQFLQGYSGVLSVSCSEQLKICGVLGPCSSLKQSGAHVSPNAVGEGLTDRWRVNGVDSDVSLAVVFELADRARDAALLPVCVQFRFEYTAADGSRVLRVVTHAFRSEYNENLQQIMAGFDQEAAACVLARLAALRVQAAASGDDAVRAIDRVCIKLARAFCQFVPNDAASVRFAANFEFFPQFMYHFRRSELVNLFGQSPDETSMKHFQLNRQSVQNMLAMLQPVLIAYEVNKAEGEPAFLDSSECRPDRVLLLDSFFNVLIWIGGTVAAWRDAGYHLKPEYANIRQLLSAAQPEAEELLKTRFPSPRYDETDQGGSQARILLARVNPRSDESAGAGEHIATDDASMQSFLDVLKKTVCAPEQ